MLKYDDTNSHHMIAMGTMYYLLSLQQTSYLSIIGWGIVEHDQIPYNLGVKNPSEFKNPKPQTLKLSDGYTTSNDQFRWNKQQLLVVVMLWISAQLWTYKKRSHKVPQKLNSEFPLVTNKEISNKKTNIVL